MGSVRRINLVAVGVVGRHKRTKSGGASLAVVVMLAVLLLVSLRCHLRYFLFWLLRVECC